MTEKLVGDASMGVDSTNNVPKFADDARMHMIRIIMTAKLVGDASMGVER